MRIDKPTIDDFTLSPHDHSNAVNGGTIASLSETLTAGENVSAGDICYLKASDGKYWKASANAVSTASTKLAMATATINANATGTFLLCGIYTTTSLTPGILYLSGTSGASTPTAPTGTGKIVRVIGTAESATKLWFNPDTTFIELA